MCSPLSCPTHPSKPVRTRSMAPSSGRRPSCTDGSILNNALAANRCPDDDTVPPLWLPGCAGGQQRQRRLPDHHRCPHQVQPVKPRAAAHGLCCGSRTLLGLSCQPYSNSQRPEWWTAVTHPRTSGCLFGWVLVQMGMGLPGCARVRGCWPPSSLAPGEFWTVPPHVTWAVSRLQVSLLLQAGVGG